VDTAGWGGGLSDWPKSGQKPKLIISKENKNKKEGPLTKKREGFMLFNDCFKLKGE